MNRKPSFYGLLYFINILIFSGVYFCFFDDGFSKSLSYSSSLYFSVVTATTLGYGDIVPSLERDALLLTISLEVILGVIIIGLFLNSVSQRLSDQKDYLTKLEKDHEKERWMSQAMSMLRPVIEIQLRTLSQYFKFTSTQEKGQYDENPETLFTEAYFKQITSINYFSLFNYANGQELMCSYFDRENNTFQERLEKFLYKYAHAIPMETLVRLHKLQEHDFLKLPGMAKNMHMIISQEKRNPKWPQDYPVPSEGMRDYYFSVCKDFHSLLLETIREINNHLSDGPLFIKVDLSNHVLPGVGCARQ